MAHGLANFDVVTRDPAWMNLVRRPAQGLKVLGFFTVGFGSWQQPRAGIGRHPVTTGAEQAVNRQTSHLAGNVPQSHVHGTDSVSRDRAIHLPQALPDGTAVERVRPDD